MKTRDQICLLFTLLYFSLLFSLLYSFIPTYTSFPTCPPPVAYDHRIPSWASPDNGIGQVVRLVKSIKYGSQAYHHYYDTGLDIDTLRRHWLLKGEAMFVDVPRNSNITAEVLKSLNIPKVVKRVFFRTSNNKRASICAYRTGEEDPVLIKKFEWSNVGFTTDGAKWLVENTDIRFVGVDYLSAGTNEDAIEAHLVLLKSRRIILVEGLILDSFKLGNYDVMCSPLRLQLIDQFNFIELLLVIFKPRDLIPFFCKYLVLVVMLLPLLCCCCTCVMVFCKKDFVENPKEYQKK